MDNISMEDNLSNMDEDGDVGGIKKKQPIGIDDKWFSKKMGGAHLQRNATLLLDRGPGKCTLNISPEGLSVMGHHVILTWRKGG